MTAQTKPGLGALAVVLRDGCALLVQRGKDPDKGLWGFPGGGVELGEPVAEAARRELAEETGVIGQPRGPIEVVDAIRHRGGALEFHYVLVAVAVDYVSGEPMAADDADDARWVPLPDITAGALPLCAHVARVAEMAVEQACTQVTSAG